MLALNNLMNPMASVASSTWKTPHTVVLETVAFRLLCFREAKRSGSIFIVPPQAGHHSYIADYKEGQSLVRSAMESTKKGVYAIEWKSCTSERRKEGIMDLLRQVDECVQLLGPCDIVGLCQGGWLATIYTAINPAAATSLTIAGAPINTHAGDSVLKHAIHSIPMSAYQHVVMMGGGMMLGDVMLANWKMFNPTVHFFDRYNSPTEKSEEFYQWYDLTQNIAGGWYLWCIRELFKGNKLYKNELEIGDSLIKLEHIQCPVHVVTGEKDDITPPEQTLALLEYVDGRHWPIDNCGHIGVFMGTRSVRDVWCKLFKTL